MQINGQPISTAAGSTLSQLLAQQGFDVARVAVELNGLSLIHISEPTRRS